MTNQPTLARTAPAEKFYYVQVCADRDEANAEMSEYFASCTARSFELVRVEPAQDDEECEIVLYVVYANELPAVEADDMLHDLYTLPHLVNAPCYDIDDLTD